ncbi:MAG: hypothetical protein K2Q24_04870 [Chitinophagaceae bacterium]|nr:hypothetical protein [Chitinophagaceae bacterium]
MKRVLLSALALFSVTDNAVFAQNIFNGEPVQVVGQMNGYSTAPAANSVYRLLSVSAGTPTDGRGQWTLTYNAQASGGDVLNTNMAGGGGKGFLFISGPASGGACGGRFNNKWVFSGVGQATLNQVNNISTYSSTCGGTDMGLDMSTAGYYTFVFNDAGYTQTNASYYVGYTAAAPVTLTPGITTGLGNGALRVRITTSATPSANERIFVRYRNAVNDFSSSTSLVEATGSGTSWTADIPSQPIGSTTYYFMFSSTRTLAELNADGEFQRSLAALRFNDNAGANFSYNASLLPVSFTSFTAVSENGKIKLNWSAEETDNLSHYEIEESNTPDRLVTTQRVEKKNETGRGSYSYEDASVRRGANYYRVLAVGKDGDKKYSQVLRVNIGTAGKGIDILPSSGSETLVIRFNEIARGTYQLNVFGNSGELVYSKRIVHDGTDQTQLIQLGKALAHGLYRVQLSGLNERFTETIFK